MSTKIFTFLLLALKQIHIFIYNKKIKNLKFIHSSERNSLLEHNFNPSKGRNQARFHHTCTHF